MNIPSVYRKAVDGFIIPPRTFFQMFISAAQGTVSLFNEGNRADFIGKLDKGTINESVLSQATTGPMMMLSLFNDLRSPLFQRSQFDPDQFLLGVGPALQNFHNVSGALENRLLRLHQEAIDNGFSEEEEKKGRPESSEKKLNPTEEAEKEAFLSAMKIMRGNGERSLPGDKFVAAVVEHDWLEQAKEDPDSLEGQLSRMLTPEVFQIHQISAKTAFLLQNNTYRFEEGSCSVNNVALLSARAMCCVEQEVDDAESSEGGETSAPRYEAVDDDMTDEFLESKSAGIAAQMEVLYDVTSTFKSEKTDESKTKTDDDTESSDVEIEESMQTTIVSVATIEGWLKGGPDGELRWRLALHRPAFEFPGIQQAY